MNACGAMKRPLTAAIWCDGVWCFPAPDRRVHEKHHGAARHLLAAEEPETLLRRLRARCGEAWPTLTTNQLLREPVLTALFYIACPCFQCTAKNTPPTARTATTGTAGSSPRAAARRERLPTHAVCPGFAAAHQRVGHP